LERDAGGAAFGLRSEFLKIIARRAGSLKEITEVSIVKIEEDARGRLKVKFRAWQSQLVLKKGKAKGDRNRKDA
jgi:hypothetical protein